MQTQVPPALAAALEELPEDARFDLIEGWRPRANGAWSFHFSARLSLPKSDFMPAVTQWHLLASPGAGRSKLHVYPDATAGIAGTFPHQDYNAPPDGDEPWRKGKPCLERPAQAFLRRGWAGEPEELREHIVWTIGRLLTWIDAAAADELLAEGDPLELPAFPKIDDVHLLGFQEGEGNFQFWSTQDIKWGFATLGSLRGAVDTSVILDFMDPYFKSIRQIDWSSAIRVAQGRVDAVWITVPQLPFARPWQSLSTWKEFSEWCSYFDVNFPAVIAAAGARLRRIRRPKHRAPELLLIGFPLPERVGNAPRRMHWLAIKNLKLCGREEFRRGFRSIEQMRNKFDRELAAASVALLWRKTANWSADQIRMRGEAEDAVRAKSILIIGVGTLGAAVAENLLRMGVTKLGLVDNDVMLVGNLSRHVLSMSDVGHAKATAMADRLNGAMPDAIVCAFSHEFPPKEKTDRVRMREWDVIVDCTASDAVLEAMASFSWGAERLFISLSMSWGAGGLIAYAASEASFPAVDAIDRFMKLSPAPMGRHLDMMEGIGCWHPVFPATADDVQLWAAVGSKFIRRAIARPVRTCSLFIQNDDGTVERREG
jgi:hypothetical protein